MSNKIFSFSQLGKHGRLGNQLFQVASTMGLAERHGARAAFPAWECEPFFETRIPHGDLQGHQIQERFFHHHEWDLPGSCDLVGYLQSEKYFGSTRLKLKPVFVQEQKDLNAEIFQRETICIQVRRGDYVGNPNYYQLPATYYLDALITHFPNWQDYNLLFTSDDMEYCRTNFEGLPNAYFPTGLTDIESLALASACDHFIISNSSFGWWCAWLGECGKPHSKIVHSGHMFAGRLARKDARDYRPDRWTVHCKDSYKIPLRDMTFTIPVFLDHPHRKENLDLCLFFLQSAFDANYIICEQGGKHFEYTSQWATYMQCDSKVFHRTKMLNDMALRAETPFIANWDCDVIIPPAQIWMATESLRAGADMVFPYDGRFARMARAQWFKPIEQAADIGIVLDHPFKGREPEHNSVGGAVMWDRESFIDGGMENERFISFGPEDCERHDRFKTLGYDIQRVRGALFHMNHHVGPNSSPRNPRFADNEKELEKIRGMSAAELRAYVDTWPWRHKYTSRYYHQISQGSIRSAEMAMRALGFKPKSIIDVGCGVGEWSNGHPDYTGIDYRVKREDLLIPAERFIECDLNREFPKLHRKFDLCTCLEVAEHLKPSRAEELVRFLCSLSDRVLFSAAIPHQGGVGHCFRGDVKVSGPTATASFSRDYEGLIVELKFSSGRFLAVTPNHPILTPHGWVAAGLLNKGGYVVCCLDGERVTSMIPNNYQVPTFIEDVVTSFGVSGKVVPVSVPLASKDFHGDGIGSQVAVIRTNSLLRGGINAKIMQPIGEFGFGRASMGLSDLPGDRTLIKDFHTPGVTFNSVNQRLNDSFPGSGLPVFTSNPIHFRPAPSFNSPARKNISNASSANAEFLGQLIRSKSRFIELDQVVNMRTRYARHPVYNLSTETGWYLANDIITHNCNEQWQSWWAMLFHQAGFGAAERQPDVRNCSDIEFWYRQNMVLYERGAAGTVQDFVLPAYYLQIVRALLR